MDQPTLPPIAARVARGAALLDLARPGWASEVEPDQLDMELAEGCVLGAGHLHRGLVVLGDTDPVGLGFDLDADDDATYVDLSAAWRVEVARRRVGHAPRRSSGLPAGPLEQAPAGPFLGEPGQRALLHQVLTGVELGAYDRRILAWLAGWDTPTVVTIASLLRRARAAGPQVTR